MIVHRLHRPRRLIVVGLFGAALGTSIAYHATARPQSGDVQMAQGEEGRDPAPARPHAVRKPKPKPAAQPAQAVSKAETPPATTPPAPGVTPAAPTSGAAVISEPVRHAREAKLGRCTETITKASSSTIDTAHAAVSTWSQKGPDDHMFQSIVALSYSNAIAPKAAAVLVAAPEGTGCEATTVQVYPTTRSCGDVEGDLKKAGRKVGDFGGLAMTQEPGASRHLLLPAPGKGCVVVAVGLAINQ